MRFLINQKTFWASILLLALFFVLFYYFNFFNVDSSKNQIQTLHIQQLRNLPKLETLDIILRTGIDYDSRIIQQISKSRFSHIGMIIQTNPISIIHASSSDTQNKVAISSFDYFLQHSKGIAIKRYVLNQHQKEKIQAFLKKQIGKDFSFHPQNPLYCTTLIQNAFDEGFNQENYLNLKKQKIDLPIFGGDFLMPEAFYQDSKSQLIFEYF